MDGQLTSKLADFELGLVGNASGAIYDSGEEFLPNWAAPEVFCVSLYHGVMLLVPIDTLYCWVLCPLDTLTYLLTGTDTLVCGVCGVCDNVYVIM